LQPDNAGAYSNLGFVYDKLERGSDSIEALKKAVQLKPDDVVAYNNLGASLYKPVDIRKQSMHLSRR